MADPVHEGFGIASLLDQEVRVYYSSLFSSRHIGQVSDLISAKLQGEIPDELRLRTLIVHAFFEAIEIHRLAQPDAHELAEPAVIECGHEGLKVALGISFNFPEAAPAPDAESVDRVRQGASQSRFEEILVDLFKHSDQLILKYQASSRRFEIVALIERDFAGEKSLEWVEFETDPASSAQAKEYIELGDLDYAKLLEGHKRAKSSNDPDGVALVKSLAEPDAGMHRVSGSKDEINSEKFVVKGGPGEVPGNGVTIVAGNGADTNDQTRMQVTRLGQASGEAPSPEKDAQIESLHKRVFELERELEQRALAAASAQPAAPAPAVLNDSSQSKGILNKIKKWLGSQEEAPSQQNPSQEQLPVAVTSVSTLQPAGEVDPKDLAEVSTKLITEIEVGKFHQIVSKLKEDHSTEQETRSQKRSNQMATSMMSDLLAEKSRLLDMAKKINTSIKQKELEFKNKERAMEQELKRKDELIRQKSFALDRAKQQTIQFQQQIEQSKNRQTASPGEAQAKLRLAQAQKILETQKEMNSKLTKRVEDLQRQVNIANMAGKNRQQQLPEMIQLQAKVERQNRQLEEFKRANRELNTKLNEKKPATKGDANEEKKLEIAAKKLVEARKETESTKASLQEAEKREAELKSQIDSLLKELETLKKNAPEAA